MDGPNERWIHTDLEQETISAIEMVREQLQQIHKDPYRWKWVILALHSAVQNFMLLALKGSNSLNVVRAKDAEAWSQAYNNDQPLPGLGKIDDFLDLYKKIKGNKMLIWSNSQKFVPKGQQGKSIKLLNSFRNEFIHFLPKSWSIEMSGLPAMSLDCVSVIDFLVSDSNNVLLNKEVRQHLKELLSTVRQSFTQLRDEYKAAPS